MSAPTPPELPDNCGQIRLFIDHEGDVSGDLAWNFHPDTPEEFVYAMQDYIHGLMSMILTDPERVAEMGKAYAAGLDTQPIEEEDDIEIVFDDPKITSINHSKRKH
jgi:hypothetical protein